MNNTAKVRLSLTNTGDRYGSISQTLHWLIVALVLVQYTLGIYAHDLPVSLERLVLIARHKSFGITIFGLMLLRLAWRLYSPPPPLPASGPKWQILAARLSHMMLYLLLLLIPVIGWLLSSASNLTVSWFGMISLPNLVAPDHAVAHWLLLTHQTLAWFLLFIIVIHICAAVWHHWIVKDDVMLRMLPFTNHDFSKEKKQ